MVLKSGSVLDGFERQERAGGVCPWTVFNQHSSVEVMRMFTSVGLRLNNG